MERIRTQNLQSAYGKHAVLQDISIEVHAGECVGIVGSNGCGKSTLLNILAGLKPIDGGMIFFDGMPAKGKEMFRKFTGYVPQESNLIQELSVRDNLLLRYPDKETLETALKEGLLSKLQITSYLKRRVSRLSGGMKKKAGIACALAGNPGVLLLDEPGGDLDLPGKEELRDYLRTYKAAGGAILIATHEEADLGLCDRIYALKAGKSVEINRDLRGVQLMRELQEKTTNQNS